MNRTSNTECRLLAIERELRWWRRFGAVVFCLAVVGASVAATTNSQPPALIRATEFQLVDRDGNVRGTFKTLGDNTQLRMYSSTGESNVALAANQQRAVLSLQKDERRNWAYIEAYAHGGSLALSRITEDGKASTVLEGGTKGSFVETTPLSSDTTRFPSD